MNETQAEADRLAQEVRACFPGAQVAQVRNLAPGAEKPGKLQIGDLLRYAEIERDRALMTRQSRLDASNESDRPESDCETLRAIAAEQGRVADAFGKIAQLIEHVRDSKVIRAELARIAQKAAKEAAPASGEETPADIAETAS
jgi:hypothetical protein